CDQMEDPRKAKGIVKREVIRTITPGTLLEENLPEEKKHNFMLSICSGNGNLAIAYCDISTADFFCTQFPLSYEKLEAELSRLKPAEVLLCGPAGSDKKIQNLVRYLGLCRARRPDGREIEEPDAQLVFQRHFGDLEVFRGKPEARSASGFLLDYLKSTQMSEMTYLQKADYYEENEYMVLDAATFRNLELLDSFSGDRRATFCHVLDRTVTAMGGRLLKKWISFPLLSREAVLQRQRIIAEFHDLPTLLPGIQEQLSGVADLERIISRLESRIAGLRDLLLLKKSLQAIPRVGKLVSTERANELCRGLDPLPELAGLLDRALYDDASSVERRHFIRDGFSSELDEFKRVITECKVYLGTLEQRERDKTGIRNLKVKFNKVFGYYIEVSKGQLERVPQEYIRKQTIAGGERYYTQELKEKESVILGSEERIKELEDGIFQDLVVQVKSCEAEIRKNARILAELDVYLSLGRVSYEYNYVRPEINDGTSFTVRGGRHPVVERMLSDTLFTGNDTSLDNERERLVILTGPNMAGKSTYIRQVALIALMAQMGSFVPAESADLCLVDRILTRVGASDNLARGESTFMVEMKETANILRHATSASLIILDEIGRGTSTFDGLAIAWAVAEYLYSSRHLGAKTLFATHYHEITQLSQTHDKVVNLSMAVAEENEEVVFLHKVVPGKANRSYGIEVARLAGLPEEVIRRARELLLELEREKAGGVAEPVFEKLPSLEMVSQMDLFGGISEQRKVTTEDSLKSIAEDLLETNPDKLTPMRALEKIYKWKKLLKE
ncbi:MAG: DNA mismatch repair protein MutS, partial [Candidatus Wallbacteria bacterium]|nr:DNA mismatch repair protein MutS [Candidatus Wallbacteria bacterium]